MVVPPEFVDKILIHDLRRLRAHEDVTVICTEGAPLSHVRAEGFRVLTISAQRKISPLTDVRTVWQLWKIFKREQFDLVHTYAPKAGLLGQFAGMLARVPGRIHGCRGLLYMRSTPVLQRTLFRATDRLTSAMSHMTLYLSDADRRYAVHERLCRESQAITIGSGIDLGVFIASEAAREAGGAWRALLGLTPEDTVVLTVGRFVGDKGYREVAQAAALLRSQHPALRFVWVAPVLPGEAGVLPDSLAAEYGIEDIVVRTGYTHDLLPALAGADILVHPSHREGVPRVVMEAAAMGLPIIASDIAGCREVVTHEHSALLFPAHDAYALAAALGTALEDRAALGERAARALADVRQSFDQDALTARIWSVHRSVLEKPASAPT